MLSDSEVSSQILHGCQVCGCMKIVSLGLIFHFAEGQVEKICDSCRGITKIQLIGKYDSKHPTYPYGLPVITPMNYL